MLNELTIRNFAIIDDLALSLAPGMTVLSGETGAGKSILIDALGLLLGDRADSEAVRDGEDRAEVTAAFGLDDAPAARAWLAERDLDSDGDCILRRVVTREGRSRNWINGSPSNARDLKALGEFLVDIHGQHAHQLLLRTAVQRDLLDDYCGCLDARETVAEAYSQLRELRHRIAELEQIDDDGNARIDLLRYQVRELQALDLKPGELAEIEAEHKRLANAQRLIDDGHNALCLLYEGEESAAVDLLGTAERLLRDLAAIDESFAGPAEAAAGARIQTQEAADDLRHTLDGLDLDPARLAELDTRLAAIQDLARKHHCEPQALTQRAEELARELSDLEGAGHTLQELYRQRDDAERQYRDSAQQLHVQRHQAARKLSEEVTRIIRDLGMPEGVFEIAVTLDEQAPPAAHGLDRIDYLVTANPGQEARPLERVASGGELSRISLAIQVVAATSARVPTLIFDEVDAGIGGGVAEIVGRLLRQLGGEQQTLCVTHLPQVAAQAQHHLRIAKQISGGATRTHIQALDADTRVEELARMLGGVDITERTLAHAREMIGQDTG